MFGKIQNSISFGRLHWFNDSDGSTKRVTQRTIRDLMIINANGNCEVPIKRVRDQLEKIQTMDQDVYVRCSFLGPSYCDNIDSCKKKKFIMEAYADERGFERLVSISEPVYSLEDNINSFAKSAKILFEEKYMNDLKHGEKADDAIKFMEELESK